jgi:hypothetical protein
MSFSFRQINIQPGCSTVLLVVGLSVIFLWDNLGLFLLQFITDGNKQFAYIPVNVVVEGMHADENFPKRDERLSCLPGEEVTLERSGGRLNFTSCIRTGIKLFIET